MNIFGGKPSKHTIKCEVEIVNFDTSHLKSYLNSSTINTSRLKSQLSTPLLFPTVVGMTKPLQDLSPSARSPFFLAALHLVSRRSHTDRNHRSRDLDRSSQIADRSFEIAVQIAAFRTRVTQQIAVWRSRDLWRSLRRTPQIARSRHPIYV